MKKKMMWMVVLLVCLCSGQVVLANEGNVSVRIEGNAKTYFYDEVVLDSLESKEGASVKEILQKINEENEDVVIEGLESGFITKINEDLAGSFGGWDGWLFTVNGVEASAGIADCYVKEGDAIVLYFGDPYGVGMQFPIVDTEKLADGILRFTSADTTYDENYNPTTTINPIVGATITWGVGDEKTTYTTDNNGEVVIEEKQLTEGKHTLQIEKVAENNLTLVLRLPSDYQVQIETVAKNAGAPSNVNMLSIMAGALAIIMISKSRKREYEK